MRMRVWSGALLGITIILVGCAPGPTIRIGAGQKHSHGSPLPPNVSAVVTVSGHSLRSLPKPFLGLSVETSALCQLLNLDRAHARRFKNLLRDLGPGVLHIGGRSSDLASWRPNGVASCNPLHAVVTTAEVIQVFELARQAGWKVLWELPLAHFDPQRDAIEARAIVSIGHGLLAGWTIGNEPDLYVESGVRSLPWGYSQYFREWKDTRQAIAAAVVGVPFTGPETCCNPAEFGSFAVDAQGLVSALSIHLYAGTKAKQPLSYLMGPKPGAKLEITARDAWLDGAKVDGLPLNITESNTFPFGGRKGVSDRFVAALWLGDFLFHALTLHFSQVDVQQSQQVYPYDPIRGRAEAGAVYYGMLLYRAASDGCTVLGRVSVTGPASVSAYSVGGCPGSDRIVVFNRSPKRKVIELQVPAPVRLATLSRLTAPALVSGPGQIQLSGSPVDANGSWHPLPAHSIPVTDVKGLRVALPRYSGAIVSYGSGP